ncbi:MAG: hypothetical protein ACOYXU_05195 [Nitrospirota bacterium]
MDITVISTVLDNLKVATDIAKLIRESDISLAEAETKLKFADLISALADAKIHVTDIQTLLMEKEEEIKSLQDQLALKKTLIWEHPFYTAIEEGKKVQYCQQCWDKDRQTIKLQGRGDGFWECKTCKNHYTDSSFRVEIGVTSRDYDPFV